MIIGINVCLSAEQIYIFKNILFTRNTFLKLYTWKKIHINMWILTNQKQKLFYYDFLV